MIPLNDTKRIKRLFTVVIGGFIVVGVMGTLALKYWWSTYPVVRPTDRLDNEIIEIRPYQSAALVTLDNGTKVTLNSSRNYEYTPYDLNEFLRKGDHLIKQPNTDTLMIVRNQRQYLFVIGAFMNERKRKW